MQSFIGSPLKPKKNPAETAVMTVSTGFVTSLVNLNHWPVVVQIAGVLLSAFETLLWRVHRSRDESAVLPAADESLTRSFTFGHMISYFFLSPLVDAKSCS